MLPKTRDLVHDTVFRQFAGILNISRPIRLTGARDNVEDQSHDRSKHFEATDVSRSNS